MRWKLVSVALLLVVFLQCGDDSDTDGNAEPVGTPVSAEMFEFTNADDLRDFRFPSDAKGAVGFRVSKIEHELVSFDVTPFFVTDGQHSLDRRLSFINTEVVRILVYR